MPATTPSIQTSSTNTLHPPARCIFWEKESALTLSDLAGKSASSENQALIFLKAFSDLQKLFSQKYIFQTPNAAHTSDHSTANKEINLFLKWRNDIPNIDFCLIKGNHDILSKNFYKDAGIKVFENKLAIKKFCFVP